MEQGHLGLREWWRDDTNVAAPLSVSIMHGSYPCTFSVSSVDYSLCLLFLVRSEGPAQVFLLVLTWLAAAFGNLARADWKKIILSYDNVSFGQSESGKTATSSTWYVNGLLCMSVYQH